MSVLQWVIVRSIFLDIVDVLQIKYIEQTADYTMEIVQKACN